MIFFLLRNFDSCDRMKLKRGLIIIIITYDEATFSKCKHCMNRKSFMYNMKWK